MLGYPYLYVTGGIGINKGSRSRVPCSSWVISPDPDAPELPPPIEADSQDTDTAPPVYQDISKLSCEPIIANSVADFSEDEQHCQQEEHDLDMDACN